MSAIVDNNVHAATDAYLELEAKIATRTARIGVIGLGYAGLPLALALSDGGFHVTGIDIDSNRVASVRAGRSYISDVRDEQIQRAVRDNGFQATVDYSEIRNLDVLCICVPTPLRKTHDPDMSYVVAAADAIAKVLRPAQLIILESSASPGTTDEILMPLLERSGWKAGQDFFLACSPERGDPGNPHFTNKDIPKVIGGVSPRCARLAALVYESATATVCVSSTRAAEMINLLENAFRSVNIALVNEIAMMCSHMKIDVWEVIQGAASKPFGYMPFYPGPGMTGQGVAIDSLYLAWKSKLDGFESRLVGLADKVNSGMPRFVVARAMESLNECGKAIRGAHVHILGVTYKKNTRDSRESPAIEIIKLLASLGATVTYSDPYVPSLRVEGRRMDAVAPDRIALTSCDLAVIVTDHTAFDYREIVQNAPLVFDTRNATDGIAAENVVRL